MAKKKPDATRHLDFSVSPMEVLVYADGSLTEVMIVESGNEEEYLARGVAKRRKGEPRNPELGTALAATRAFAELTERYAVLAEKLLR